MFFIKKYRNNIQIENNVKIGKNIIIGKNVVIKSGTVIKNNVIIGDNTIIGNNNKIFSFSSIGSISQDRKYIGEPTYLEIGDNNTFREFTLVNKGTNINSKTIIGNNNLFLAYSIIGHDAVIKDNSIIGCYSAVGGHSSLFNNVRLCAHSCVTPFCRMGEYSFLAANSKIISDIIPFCTAEGNPAKLRNINIWALKKQNFNKEKVQILRKLYETVINEEMQLTDKLNTITTIDPTDIFGIYSFIKCSKFGVINKVKKH